MGKNSRRVFPGQHRPTPAKSQRVVPSLLDAVEDGKEYGSIVSAVTPSGFDLLDDIVRGLEAIEQLRNRPCIAYVGNVVGSDDGSSGVDATDDLPFAELVAQVPASARAVDVYLATRGGSGHQISRFVNCLRARFDEVDFIIPSFCMSAGTLFALSGDHIFMSERACLGPIDPQVPTAAGRFVPAQALLLLVEKLQKEGQEALATNRPVPWTAVRIIDTIDKKELGDAITASTYSTMMATEFLVSYKFRNWSIRESSKLAVTDDYRRMRAVQIADALASHDRWRSHGHAISREVLWQEIQLKIDQPSPELERAIKRLWAVFHWLFDKTPVLKVIASSEYRYLRHAIGKKNP
jgi:hypothetical protein